MINWKWIAIYYLWINFITFFLFWYDKRKARHHQYRISEKSLLGCVLLGGCLGSSLAMTWIHHKNRKKKFILFTILAFLLHGIFWIKWLR